MSFMVVASTRRSLLEQSNNFTFTFEKKPPLWKLFLLSSVNPQLCCLIDQRFCMWSVQSLLQDSQRPQKAHALARWKEVSQLQPVWLLKQQTCYSEKTHASSLLRLLLHISSQPEEAHAYTFRRETFQLHSVTSLCQPQVREDLI